MADLDMPAAGRSLGRALAEYEPSSDRGTRSPNCQSASMAIAAPAASAEAALTLIIAIRYRTPTEFRILDRGADDVTRKPSVR